MSTICKKRSYSHTVLTAESHSEYPVFHMCKLGTDHKGGHVCNCDHRWVVAQEPPT